MQNGCHICCSPWCGVWVVVVTRAIHHSVHKYSKRRHTGTSATRMMTMTTATRLRRRLGYNGDDDDGCYRNINREKKAATNFSNNQMSGSRHVL